MPFPKNKSALQSFLGIIKHQSNSNHLYMNWNSLSKDSPVRMRCKIWEKTHLLSLKKKKKTNVKPVSFGTFWSIRNFGSVGWCIIYGYRWNPTASCRQRSNTRSISHIGVKPYRYSEKLFAARERSFCINISSWVFS